MTSISDFQTTPSLMSVAILFVRSFWKLSCGLRSTRNHSYKGRNSLKLTRSSKGKKKLTENNSKILCSYLGCLAELKLEQKLGFLKVRHLLQTFIISVYPWDVSALNLQNIHFERRRHFCDPDCLSIFDRKCWN